MYLVLGYSDLYSTGEANLTVRVESDPRKPAIRSAILQAAEDGALDTRWVRRIETWQALSSSRRAATVDEKDASVKWFAGRLDELASAGVTATVGPKPRTVSGRSPA